ncbi:hypothetical protein BD310DRAFT_671605 [Dichomitus squalens]|uniref:Uncharacterized protein n=1 Tax=Dichomitus squalens TaxID=114155 RepID=A0A4Q9PN51_9APHY|nr:hypothetical protein BD310DRAFT_671605 [Dichomitus squalens]
MSDMSMARFRRSQHCPYIHVSILQLPARLTRLSPPTLIAHPPNILSTDHPLFSQPSRHLPYPLFLFLSPFVLTVLFCPMSTTPSLSKSTALTLHPRSLTRSPRFPSRSR